MASFVLLDFLHEAAQRNAKEIYIIPGSPMHIRCNGSIVKAGEMLMPRDTESIIQELYALAKRRIGERYLEKSDDNFSFTIPGVARFRVSVFRQRNSFGCIMRMIGFSLPSTEDLHIPPEVMNAADYSSGLILIAGYSGSGKTTTLASLIQKIKHTKVGKLIITLENPLEYLHSHDKSMVIQREIYTDTPDYSSGIQAALYQRPDVLVIGDLPSDDVIRQTIIAAHTGRLVFSTLYGDSSADALSGLLAMFSLDEQKIICMQLARELRMIIYQRMVPGIDGKSFPVFETVEMNGVLAQLLLQNDLSGFRDAILNSKTAGIIPFDRNIVRCYRKKLISYNAAIDNAMDKTAIRRMLR